MSGCVHLVVATCYAAFVLSSIASEPGCVEEPEKSLLVERTNTWYKETDQKLSVLVHRMVSLVSHDKWKVRLAMAVWCHTLLVRCSGNLPVCLPSLLEVLVTLSHDSYTHVANTASSAMVSER